MTTTKRPFSGRNTANNQAAQRESAERRRCPSCHRNGALGAADRQDWGDGAIRTFRQCRWCGHEAMVQTGQTYDGL